MNMKKGFTLIEIMIVVAIIAILAAIAIPNFVSYRKTSQQNACKANMKQIMSAVEAYRVKNGSIPASVASLTLSANGAFLKTEPKCPYDGTSTYSIGSEDANGNVAITCPNASAVTGFPHVAD